MSGIGQETVAVIGTGIALAVLIVPSLRELRRDVGDARERLARLERHVRRVREARAGGAGPARHDGRQG